MWGYMLRLILVPCLIGMMTNFTTAPVNSLGIRQAEPSLMVTPSSIVIRVGESARANITFMDRLTGQELVCFRVEDFPASGFIISIEPQCANPDPSHSIKSVLTVEATPAAAPQTFTASLVAEGGDWTEQAPIRVTVEPEMSAWIPWSIILVVILLLLSPLLVKEKKKSAKLVRTGLRSVRKRSGVWDWRCVHT
jgi:hypothetical protein